MEVKNLFSCGLCELKFADPGTEAATMSFSGYGAVFGNVDAYGDVIAPGAFKDTLKEAQDSGIWPAMLSQHGGFDAQSNTPIGVWTVLDEDAKGLRVEGQLADTPRGREAYTLLKMQPRPAYNGLSIGYYPIEWTNRSKPDEPRRTLKKVKLGEISLVTFPANDKARVGQVKGMPDKRFLEQLLCDAGLSRRQAKALIAEGYNGAFSACDEPGGAGEELKAILQRNINTLRGK